MVSVSGRKGYQWEEGIKWGEGGKGRREKRKKEKKEGKKGRGVLGEGLCVNPRVTSFEGEPVSELPFAERGRASGDADFLSTKTRAATCRYIHAKPLLLTTSWARVMPRAVSEGPKFGQVSQGTLSQIS